MTLPIQTEVELVALIGKWRVAAINNSQQAQHTQDLRQRIGHQTNVTTLTLCADELERIVTKSRQPFEVR